MSIYSVFDTYLDFWALQMVNWCSKRKPEKWIYQKNVVPSPTLVIGKQHQLILCSLYFTSQPPKLGFTPFFPMLSINWRLREDVLEEKIVLALGIESKDGQIEQKVVRLTNLSDYEEEAITSKEIVDGKAVSVTVHAFDHFRQIVEHL